MLFLTKLPDGQWQMFARQWRIRPGTGRGHWIVWSNRDEIILVDAPDEKSAAQAAYQQIIEWSDKGDITALSIVQSGLGLTLV